MADWHGTARTNYFPVLDVEVFKAWAQRASLRPFQHAETGLWGVYSEDYFGG